MGMLEVSGKANMFNRGDMTLRMSWLRSLKSFVYDRLPRDRCKTLDMNQCGIIY